jgi:glucokinase
LAVIGIDAGGTKIAALVLHDDQVVEKHRIPTDTTSAQSVVVGLGEITSLLRERVASQGIEVEAVGVGAAGFIDYGNGVVTFSPNLPLLDTPLRDLLQKQCGIPVYLDNDANVAALAEARMGAGRGARFLVHLTLGTGIGGGIIIDGRVYRGALGAAAELGHMVIMDDGPPCTCGARGCLEALASGWSIAARVKELADKQVDSPLVDDYLKDPDNFGAEKVVEHADAGERFALTILSEAGKHLGVGVGSLVNIFNPDVVTFSGGLLGAYHHMEENMRLAAERISIPISRGHVRILAGTLGDEGGQIGAALLPSSQSVE